MTRPEWPRVPIGLDASQWVSRAGCLSVLAVVHTVTSGQRLLEAVELIETDTRLQVVFTQAPDVFSNGVAEFLRSTGGIVWPWELAIRQEFALAVAASYGGLHELHAPLVVMPHGAGYGKSFTTGGEPVVYGLDAQRLLHNGRVLASALVLAHDDEREVLRRQCPQALDVAVVAGDPTYDRLVASLPRRDEYRAALGIEPGQQAVVVSSTWGLDSLFARFEDLLPSLLEELTPHGFRVVALVHPGAWFGHGKRQVDAWLAECRDAGLVVVGPHVDWRAAVIAADHVVADHGSVGVYAAAIGRPVVLVDAPVRVATSSGSAQELLRHLAPRFQSGSPVRPQLDLAAARAAELGEVVRERLTSEPGRSSARLRRIMYELLDLPEPGRHRAVPPVPTPPEESP
ncbi:hypothetical protein B0I31_103581 [Saccharothrix carnea]|uniref:CDP-glycerol:poly(Glycerophosphate) glycerophosphotransferase n=1 Tax=Saccharothrix carnea TaxID=1280637 RepID=A0A2P8IEE1_SACCR|nr:hypothetical protein [Saccharothrix carnea]PSL56822.1 hypothetical protein B0I31_103581 [Saccharothrix carnea]